MEFKATCHNCGDALEEDGDSISGLCAACLLRQGLGGTAQEGRKIGSYEILGVLGRGGMGVVYRAYEPALNRIVALKVLSPEAQNQPLVVKRFQREAQAAAALHHPNIVPLHAIGEYEGVPYIAMEYIEGLHLGDYCREQETLSPRQVVQIIGQVNAALCAAHEAGILHRDIKPHNIMIDKAGQVHVMDFGLAKRISGAESALTEEGTFLGTLSYASPEQISGGSVGPPSDLYSLGVLMFELLTGRLPFGGNSPREMVRLKLKGDFDHIEKIRPDLSPELTSIVNRLLALDPTERFDAANALADALAGLEGKALESGRMGVYCDSSYLPTEQMAKPLDVAVRVEREPALPLKRHLTPAFLFLIFFCFASFGLWSLTEGGQAEYQIIDTRPGETIPGDVQTMDVALTNDVSIKMVYVPGGNFRMGVPDRERGASPGEKILHNVTLDAYWMGQFEITNEQYRLFRPEHSSQDYKGLSLNGAKQPVVHVSWNDANAFCEWLSEKTGRRFQLPTEAQWEYACRAGSTTAYSRDNSIASLEGYENVYDLTSKAEIDYSYGGYSPPPAPWEDGFAVSAPVGSFKPNAWGFYDMAGNVREWCRDWYGEFYYSESPEQNPTGPPSGEKKIARGGFWADPLALHRSGYRDYQPPNAEYFVWGFRVVLEEDVQQE